MNPWKNQYYLHREPTQSPDFESPYWDSPVDPDGIRRNRFSEREQFLQDARSEINFINSLPPGKILDFGCGAGFFLSGLKSSHEKYGLEISIIASREASRWGSIHTGTLETSGFETCCFDAIILYHVIEHLADPEKTILQLRKLLKPSGILLVGTPDFDSGCARRFGSRYRLLHDSTHISLFSYLSLHRFLSDHGFIVDLVDFPYFETRHFTQENLMRLFDTEKISPPFYGNFLSFYCHKPSSKELKTFIDSQEEILNNLKAQINFD